MKKFFIGLLGIFLFAGCSQNSEKESIKNTNDNDISIIAYLKQEGIDITTIDSVDECVKLHMRSSYNEEDSRKYCNSIKEGKEEFLQWVKSADKDPNVRDIYERTLLMEDFSDEQKQIALTKVLLLKGADPNLVDEDGKTALMHASDGWPRGDQIRLLPSERVRLLLEAGANVNVMDKNGNTALYYAVNSSQNKIVHLLLRAGAYPNTISKYGETLLHIACNHGEVNIVEDLLKAGANPNIKDAKGRTVLQCADDWAEKHHGNAAMSMLVLEYLRQ